MELQPATPNLSLLAHADPGAVEAAAAAPPRAVRALIALVAGASIAGISLSGLDLGGQDWVAIALLALFGVIAERLETDLYGDSSVSVSALFMLTAAVHLGPVAVAVVNPCVALAAHIGSRDPVYKLIFNASVFILAGLTSYHVYSIVRAFVGSDARPVQAAAVMAAAVADFSINTSLVAAVIALTHKHVSPIAVWREKYAWLLPHYLGVGFLAFVLMLASRHLGVYGLLGFVAPGFMMRFSIRQYVRRTEDTVSDLKEKHARIEVLTQELSEAYQETLQAFTSALDTRDVETSGHSTRVSETSLEIGAAMGVRAGTPEWLNLKYGSMLHDVGKIGVPDAILRKPGGLTDDEWSAIREHPMIGYRLLRGVRFLETAAELVLCHHERWDGKGYPRGLAGDQIPLAARIFMVADTYDAIISVRPYKAARSHDDALAEIRRHAGTQFDADVVDALFSLRTGGAKAA